MENVMSKKYTLPKEFGTKWIEALRSGEYVQTTHKLTDGNGHYCCLGVACKVVSIPDNILLHHNKMVISGDWAYNLGIPEEIDAIHCNCTQLNDIERKSFPEIAFWLEENVKLI